MTRASPHLRFSARPAFPSCPAFSSPLVAGIASAVPAAEVPTVRRVRRRPGDPPPPSDAHVLALAPHVRRLALAWLGEDGTDEVDDVVQETLARVLEVRDRLDRAALVPYALTTARNQLVSRSRERSRDRRHAHRLLAPMTTSGPEEEVLRGEEHRALAAALRRLPAADAALLVAHQLDETDTGKLAAETGTTAGAVAARLARARARLRLEFLLHLRGVIPPTSRCRPVLLALAAGDRRRQQAVGAGRHLDRCATCAQLAEPLLSRRRALAGLLPWAPLPLTAPLTPSLTPPTPEPVMAVPAGGPGLAGTGKRGRSGWQTVLALVASALAVLAVFVLLSVLLPAVPAGPSPRLPQGPTAPAAASGAGQAEPEAPPRAGAETPPPGPPPTTRPTPELAGPAAGSVAGPVPARSGTSRLPASVPLASLQGAGRLDRAGNNVRARAVRVLAVPADEGFWIGTRAQERRWVQLAGTGESPITVRPGQRLDFTARLVPTPPGFAHQAGVDPAEGAAQLQHQAVHLAADPTSLRLH